MLSGSTISHYRVEKQIGAGGMGEVYKAFDTRLERPVAIKRLRFDLNNDPGYRRRLLREARHAAQISHHGVAAVHDVIEQEGELFLVMEYVEGQNLSDAGLDRSNIQALLKIAVKCTEALLAAHRIGVIHRDIKPANIMLTNSGEIKILDFGLAKRDKSGISDDESTTSEITREGAIHGTWAYMSPEVLCGRPADRSSDLFSLGIVLYQLLTGQHPFAAGTRANTISNILNSRPNPIVRLNPLVPLELEDCVSRLLEKDPELRYASAEDLLAHLKKIERDVSQPSGRSAPIPYRRPRVGRRWVAAGLLSVVVLAVAAFVLLRKFSPPSFPEKPVIAVIPFAPVEQDRMSTAFSTGLAEMITLRLNVLSMTQPYTVIPTYRGRQFSTPQDAESVGANVVLTGQLELREGNVVVTVKLVSATTGKVLREYEVQAPLSRPADLEYRILEKCWSILNDDRSPPDRLLLRSYPSSQAPYIYFLRGLGCYLSDQPAEAIDNFENALQMEPNFALGKAYLGLVTLQDTRVDKADRVQRAERLCSEAQALDPQLHVADLCLAEAALARNDLEHAVSDYESALQKGPADYDVLYGLLDSYRRLGRLNAVVPSLQAMIDRKPELWLGYEFLAYVHYVLGDIKAAVVQQKKAVELAPKRPSGRNYLAVFYDLLGCPDKAAASYQAALELGRNSQTYTNLAVTQFYAGRYREALEAAQEAKVYLDREPEASYVEAGNLGDIYYWAPGGNRETARVFYREALDLVEQHLRKNPDDLSALRCKCWYLAMLEQFDLARQCLKSLVAVPRLDYQTAYKLALIYERVGQPREALDYLQRSLNEGKRASQVLNEPIFRSNQAVQDLLARYPTSRTPCD